MSQDQKDIRTSVEKIANADEAVEHELATAIGGPTRQQKTLLASLNRLSRSLQGPESLLNRFNYNRLVPPEPHHVRTYEPSHGYSDDTFSHPRG